MKPILTIDIGGTKIKTGLVDHQGKIVKKNEFATPRKDYSQFPSLLKEHIALHYKDAFYGIAFSATGICDLEKRTIGGGGPMYEAFGKTILNECSKIYQMPISAENDGNCAALAENWLGAGKGAQSICTIVLGTSVGGAIVVDQHILHGKHNLSGEFGYFLIAQEIKPYEIWSIVGSTRGLVQSVAKEKNISERDLNGYKVLELMENKDPIAVQKVKRFIELLAVQCYNIQYAIDPEKILIGGGISTAPFLIPALKEEIKKIGEMIPSTVVLPEVDRCRFGNESNLIGAAYQWLQENRK